MYACQMAEPNWMTFLKETMRTLGKRKAKK